MDDKRAVGIFDCSNNQLTSLEGRPKASKYVFYNNPLQRLGNERVKFPFYLDNGISLRMPLSLILISSDKV